jgi:hypothetical protein
VGKSEKAEKQRSTAGKDKRPVGRIQINNQQSTINNHQSSIINQQSTINNLFRPSPSDFRLSRLLFHKAAPQVP